MKKTKKFYKLYKRQLKNFSRYCRRDRRSAILMALIILISFLAMGAANVRAAARYAPGQTLTPDCGPTDPDCTVSSPLYTSASLDIGSSPQAGYYTATSTTATSVLAGGLSVAGTAGLTVLPSGNVGIGTTSPYAKLSIVGGSSGTVIAADALSGFSGNLFDLKVASTSKFTVGSDGSLTTAGNITSTALGSNMILTTNGSGMIVASSTPTVAAINATSTTATSTFAGGFAIGTNKFVVDGSTGNVGVGTISPGSQLTQTLTTTIPAGELIKQHQLNFSVSGLSDDLVVQGTRTLEVNTMLYGTYDMATISGLYANTYNYSTSGTTTHLIGTLGTARNMSTGDVSRAYGIYGRIDQTGIGHIDNAYGVFSNGPILTAGTVNNYYGYGAGGIGFEGAVVTNAYGAGITIPSGATTNNIGLLVGNAPVLGASNYAAYINGTVYVTGATQLATTLSVYGDYLQVYGSSNLRDNINLINKAGTDWLHFAEKNSTGAENVYNLANIGSLTSSGIITSNGGATFNSTLDAMGVFNASGSYAMIVGALDLKSNINLVNKAGTNWLSFATKNSTGAENVYDLTNIGTMKIAGNVGIGTTSPMSKLSIFQSANTVAGGISLSSLASSTRSIYMDDSNILHFSGNGTDGTLNASGVWTDSSDIAYKNNIIDMKYGLADLFKLEPKQYTMKVSGIPQIGLIAQDVEKVIPEVVSGEEGHKGIAYGQLTALLIQAVKEISTKLDNFIANGIVNIKNLVVESITAAVGNFKEVNTEKINADQLCVDNICVTKDQFKQMLLNAGGTMTSSSTITSATSTDTTNTSTNTTYTQTIITPVVSNTVTTTTATTTEPIQTDQSTATSTNEVVTSTTDMATTTLDTVTTTQSSTQEEIQTNTTSATSTEPELIITSQIENNQSNGTTTDATN